MQEKQLGEHDAETFALIGAGMEVHRELGPGFLEAVYHHAMKCELSLRGIPFQSQVAMPVRYKNQLLDAITAPISSALIRLWSSSKPWNVWATTRLLNDQLSEGNRLQTRSSAEFQNQKPRIPPSGILNLCNP